MQKDNDGHVKAAIEATIIVRATDLATTVLAVTEGVREEAYAQQVGAIQQALTEAFPNQTALEAFLAEAGYGQLGDLVAYGTPWHHVPHKLTERIACGALQGGFRTFVRKALAAKPESHKLLAIMTPLVPKEGLEGFLRRLDEADFDAATIAAFDRRTLSDLRSFLMTREAIVRCLLSSARDDPMGFAKLVRLHARASEPAA